MITCLPVTHKGIAWLVGCPTVKTAHREGYLHFGDMPCKTLQTYIILRAFQIIV